MAKSETEIYNLALDAVGTRSKVSLPTEDSREAQTCNRWFDRVRDQVLRAAHWPTAKAYQRLALVVERDDTVDWVNTDPEPGYRFAYGYPVDMLAPRYFSTFEPFEVGVSTINKRLIMANAETPVLIYTKRQVNIDVWDEGLYWAIVHALAAHIALPLHGKTVRARKAQEDANAIIMQARENSSNVGERMLESVPDWISARGYAEPQQRQRFLHPFGPLIQHVGPSANVE